MNRHADLKIFEEVRRLEKELREQMKTLVPAGTRCLVAVSGGPDSMALLHALRALPYALEIGHIDHQLRRGSAADARFVRKMAMRWDVKVHEAAVPVRRHAARHGKSIEEAARDLRYAALVRMAGRRGCAAVLTAHTADDQAETVLLNFLRGAGPAGLAGMRASRPLGEGRSAPILVRPLLNVWKNEIELYLKHYSVPYRVDPSNRNPRFRRNWIRHRLLPLLEKKFPDLRQRLLRTASIFKEDDALLAPQVQKGIHKTMRKNGPNAQIDLTRVFGYHESLARRILRHFMPGLTLSDVEVLKHAAGAGNRVRRIRVSAGPVLLQPSRNRVYLKRGLHV